MRNGCDEGRCGIAGTAALLSLLLPVVAVADRPSLAYIFPAGGKRGTTVKLRIGGYNLHDSAALSVSGSGIKAPKRITGVETVFFEGPVIPQPASQRKEDYPRDYEAHFRIDAKTPPGVRYWRVSTSQGVTPAMKFVVGDLPEVVEHEVDGAPIPADVSLPVTINGRIFPREDVDVWTFEAKRGRAVTCEVMAARLGSPLDSRLEVRDSDGRRIAENVDALGVDSRLSFVPPKDGRYSVRIHDVKFNGLQNYVYRLTITDGPYVTSMFPLGGRRGTTVQFALQGANLGNKTASIELPQSSGPACQRQLVTKAGRSNQFQLELDDLMEYVEPVALVKLPAILNGRIAKPGEVDSWQFSAKKGKRLNFDLMAARLGSPLDSVLTVFDAKGKQIAAADDLGSGQTDSRLQLTIPADGTYTIRVAERLETRGGQEYSYRLRITDLERPSFLVKLPTDALTVDREKTGKMKINVARDGGFKDEIILKVDGLPEGVSVTGLKIGKGKNNTQLTFKTTASAKIGTIRLRVTGTAKIDGQAVTRAAVREFRPDDPLQSELFFCVAMPTPFKFSGEFETRYAARGSTYYRPYKLERNGFKGPITVRLADRQIRHLQGVKGPTIVLPPGTTEFRYPVSLAPWMVVGRTSRSCIMAVGVVTDKDGSKHKVSYSSTAQNDQALLLVDPARLSVQCKSATILFRKGKTVRWPISVGRGSGLAGAITVELIAARHMRGVKAAPIVIPKGANKGRLALEFSATDCGPFNMPLIIRATLNKGSRSPLTAEFLLTVVDNSQPTPLSYFESRR